MGVMEIEIIKFSRKIKKFREEKNFTQEELAEKLGVSRQSIISLERGRCLPSLPLALSFSQFFELPLEEIFFGSEQKEMEVNKMTYDLMPNHPIQEVSSLHEAIDRVFSGTQEVIKTPTLPLINVYEKNGQIVVEADVPGIAEEDLNIEVTDDSVTISGVRKEREDAFRHADFYRHEVDYGSFSRTIALPNLVDKEKAEAELKNGILTISLDKYAEIAPKITRIKIKKN